MNLNCDDVISVCRSEEGAGERGGGGEGGGGQAGRRYPHQGQPRRKGKYTMKLMIKLYKCNI